MKKQPTLQQIRALDVILSFNNFEQQSAALYVIWVKHTLRQKQISEMRDMGLIRWLEQSETQFEQRWKLTQLGVDALLKDGERAGVL